MDHAHHLGYWIRFYTLDGFPPAESLGWDAGYNFGSRDAVLPRWKAALAAGVDFIATDQYEDLAAVMKMTGNPELSAMGELLTANPNPSGAVIRFTTAVANGDSLCFQRANTQAGSPR